MTQHEGSQLFNDGAGETASPWLARARSNLQVMYRTALAVSHTLDIDQLLNRIMQLIFEWVEADRGCIMLLDPETKKLTPKVRRNRQGIDPDEKTLDQQDDSRLRPAAQRRRADQRRARRQSLEPGGQHRAARRARGDLRADARPLRRGRRHLHRHVDLAAADAAITGATSSPKTI